MPLELAHRHFGGEENPPLVILHGLLGSSRNWVSAGAKLTEDFEPHALDLRNHGESPWSDSFSYAAMAEDVRHWMNRQDLQKVVLMGHSMGGKVAMAMAMKHPERLHGLVLVDVPPRESAPRWENEFAAMRKIEAEKLSSRGEAEAFLEAEGVPGRAFRQFLLSNLVRQPEGGFRWRVNLDVLAAALPDIFKCPIEEDEVYEGPTLALRGERSNFVRGEDLPHFHRHFPQVQLVTIKDAGHNVHTEQEAAFVQALTHWWRTTQGE